jgi:hypothetical protein
MAAIACGVVPGLNRKSTIWWIMRPGWETEEDRQVRGERSEVRGNREANVGFKAGTAPSLEEGVGTRHPAWALLPRTYHLVP